MWWAREGVCLSRAGLAVAEGRGGESVDAHVDQPLDPRVLEDVLLAGLGLEHHVEGEGLQLVITLLFVHLA